MNPSPNNQRYLAFLQDIHDVSQACGTTTYIWGGFTLDLLVGHWLREHHDLDGFTLNLLEVLPEMSALYRRRGYEVAFLEEWHILRIDRDGLHAAFNRLERDGETAMWRHIGDRGTVFFPYVWLDREARDFQGVPVYAAGAELDYALKAEVALLSPEWRPRPQDSEALARLEGILADRGIAPADVLSRIWSDNPFWAERGYPAIVRPAPR